MICYERMVFAYSESARLVRSALGAVLRQRREATRRTLTEVAGEAGLSPAHLSEVERGRKEVSTERLLAGAHALGARPADSYPHLARPPRARRHLRRPGPSARGRPRAESVAGGSARQAPPGHGIATVRGAAQRGRLQRVPGDGKPAAQAKTTNRFRHTEVTAQT